MAIIRIGALRFFDSVIRGQLAKISYLRSRAASWQCYLVLHCDLNKLGMGMEPAQ
jgi:hypothetical protein